MGGHSYPPRVEVNWMQIYECFSALRKNRHRKKCVRTYKVSAVIIFYSVKYARVIAHFWIKKRRCWNDFVLLHAFIFFLLLYCDIYKTMYIVNNVWTEYDFVHKTTIVRFLRRNLRTRKIDEQCVARTVNTINYVNVTL